jgi:hypothetical protein
MNQSSFEAGQVGRVEATHKAQKTFVSVVRSTPDDSHPRRPYLDQAPDGCPAGGHDVLLVRIHDVVRLRSTDLVLGEVHIHLVAVKIGVVGAAQQRRQSASDRPKLHACQRRSQNIRESTGFTEERLQR